SLSGSAERPASVPSVAGLPPGVVDEVVVMPFNDTEAARAILEEHTGELAAVIIEPVLGGSGMVPAEQPYLDMLREFTEADGSVLIFDEVISFRVAYGGAQEPYGIRPDMTTFGKIIGGGFPVGAFGGRRDLMELYDPTKGPTVSHAGTFNANPVTMLAGTVTLEQLTPEVYRGLAELTERLKQGLREACASLEVPAQITGLGSLFGIHFTEGPVRGYRDVAAGNSSLRHQVFLGLMNEGFFTASNLVGALSTEIGEAEVDAFVGAFTRVLERQR
ncbi:MAG: aminotransferase class III-fold pyridoxal phosphate-dependent enzyme, partial [Chloroflexi bacterium]|nr:aminotransferase class III-fold pyridoxal phosphate-dependent enzyme [Chloroflexota bacterium]